MQKTQVNLFGDLAVLGEGVALGTVLKQQELSSALGIAVLQKDGYNNNNNNKKIKSLISGLTTVKNHTLNVLVLWLHWAIDYISDEAIYLKLVVLTHFSRRRSPCIKICLQRAFWNNRA